jgi:hypothetical protein
VNSYYVVEREYVGPDRNRNRREHTYSVTTEPARTNMGRQPITSGWAGTTNDVSVTARGEYPTLTAAVAAIAALCDEDGYREDETADLDNHEVARYAHGSLEPWSADESGDWAAACQDEVTALSDDDALQRLVDEAAQALADAEGGDLDEEAVLRMLTEQRDALREEALDRIDDEAGYEVEQTYSGWRIRLSDEADEEREGWIGRFYQTKGAALTALLDYVRRRRPALLAD